MIDKAVIERFEAGVATVLDALDQLRALDAPADSEGLAGIHKWHAKVRSILSSMPELPDDQPLTEFAEGVEREVAQVKMLGGGPGEGEKRYPRDEGLLPDKIPDGTADNDILLWDHTDKVWEPTAPTEITVITGYRLSGLNFQIKTQTIRVISADAESAWSTAHTGTECP